MVNVIYGGNTNTIADGTTLASVLMLFPMDEGQRLILNGRTIDPSKTSLLLQDCTLEIEGVCEEAAPPTITEKTILMAIYKTKVKNVGGETFKMNHAPIPASIKKGAQRVVAINEQGKTKTIWETA